MKLRLILVTVFSLAVVPLAAMAQPSQHAKTDGTLEPPPLPSPVAATRLTNDEVISSLLAVQAEIPRGPGDVLKGYENAMTVIAERISAELANISAAVRLGHITRDQADYLTQQTYQLAVMQYQVLSTLHDSLAHDMARASIRSRPSLTEPESDTTLAVEPRFEGRSQ